jgi:large subunit ribosomal protein L10
MNREQKAATIDALAADIQGAEAIFAVDYRGISVPQAAELRSKLREGDATFTVVKNSLTERAADQVGAEALKEFLSGPTALTFVRGDAAMAAKAVADFARANQMLPFKGGLLNGDVLDAEQIRSISRLPSREVLYGQLVGIVASPISGLVRTLNALVGGLAIALGQVKDKKESGEIPAGEAPAAEAAPAAPEEPQAEASEPAVEESAEASVEEASVAETPAAEESAEASVEEAPAAEAPATEQAPTAEEETAKAEETAAEAAPEEKTEPEPSSEDKQDEPAQDDNQTEASADEQPETAEATKED